MKIYKYKNYEEYIEAQKQTNERKKFMVFVDGYEIINLVVEYIDSLKLKPKLMLCHGVRNGIELEHFMDGFIQKGYTPKIIGTEIGDTALNYKSKHTKNCVIQWDFHEVKKEWIGNVDIIYSNSFDHSCKPIECLDTWMSCLTDDGVCIIEFNPGLDDEGVHDADCFAASIDEYREFITKKYNIINEIDNEPSNTKRRIYLFIQNKRDKE